MTKNLFLLMKKILGSILLVLGISCNSGRINDSLLVRIESGKISGTCNSMTGIRSFKGIPYAKPPVGNLRWQAPQPPEPWNGILDCRNYAASAMQSKPEPFSMWTSEFIAPAHPISEDCLYLNIWTGANSAREKRPVIIFIHGGGFSAGSGSVPVYDGEEMAKKGVVFVAINYRLGIFGFLAHPELTAESEHHASGNYGLLDQIESLKWIHKNIAAFGGDPNNITLAGQSAGAVSVNYLIASPLSKGLFQRAIAESGGAILPSILFPRPLSLHEAEDTGLNLAGSLNAPTLSDLRKVSSKKLLKIKFLARPIIDGYVVTADVSTVFINGRQNDVPILIGWNANEGNFIGQLLNAKSFILYSKKTYGTSADTFLSYFPATNDSVAEKSQLGYSALLTFGVQMYDWMKLQTNTGKSEVYLYYFMRKVPFGKGQQNYGAFHSSELPYAYHTLRMSKTRPWNEVDLKLEQVMSDYWVNFANNGNPNGDNLPRWSPCLPNEYSAMILGDTLELSSVPFREQLEFLRNYIELK
jgi:para-nitrobenzyl esterase